MANWGSLICIAIEVILISKSFWWISRPKFIDENTWHIRSSFSIFLWKSGDVKVYFFDKRFSLWDKLEIEFLDGKNECILDESYGLELKLSFEGILRIRELNIEGILRFRVWIVRISFVFFENGTQSWLWNK